ncbi:MAG: HAD family hydrolase [Candidatus Eremiobacteraeota bacterium]|nr:HAD family hydrolase [Candidatus Eremiobacteraeota bacterium]
MKRPQLTTVLFDLDDTLHDDTLAYRSGAEEVARKVAAEHNIDGLALKDAYVAQAEGFWERLAPAQLVNKLASVRAALWEAALSEVGLHDPELAARCAVQYNTSRRKYFKMFPGAVELLIELRSRGVKLGLLTNGFAETHREKIALLKIGEFFDAIFIADEVGMLKPDPLLFAHACRKLRSSPSRSAMVGDRYERDIAGALQAGLYTIWINVHGATLPAASTSPHVTVNSILEAAGALRSI